MEVNFERFAVSHLAGCALLAAEGASYFSGNSLLTMEEVSELILLGGFDGINELYSLKSVDVEEGLIIYLRRAVQQLRLVEMESVSNSVSRMQKSERSFSPPKPSLYRRNSLFQPGFSLV